MYSFKIFPKFSFFTHPETEERIRGRFLKQSVDAYFHDNYLPGDSEKREQQGTVENIICKLKDQFNNTSESELNSAIHYLIEILDNDLEMLSERYKNFTVCIVPRAKTEEFYNGNQLFFKKCVSHVVSKKPCLKDGGAYLLRKIDTRTTHMDRSGWGGDGALPYPGITKDTCEISELVKGENILLIDDLYTEGCNVDEDSIQALLDIGAKSVVFYSIGKTFKGA